MSFILVATKGYPGGAHTECDDFCAHQECSAFVFILAGLVKDAFQFLSRFRLDMSRAVLEDLGSHPETVHPAVYTVIVIGSVRVYCCV